MKAIESVPSDENGMVRAEHIVRALGINDGQGFENLLEALRVDSDIETQA